MEESPTDAGWMPARWRWPMVVGVLAALVVAFFTGYAVARTGTAVAPPRDALTLTAGVPGRELVDLLADVDRSMLANPSEAVEYPSFFGDAREVAVPQDAASPGLRAVVRPGRPGAPSADGIPAGEVTLLAGVLDDQAEAVAVRDRLRAAGIHAWMRPERVDGRARWQVAVGGFDDGAAARAAGPALWGLVREAWPEVGAWEVVDIDSGLTAVPAAE